MAGGNFTLSSPKVRPGTYVNVINGRQPTASRSPVGIGMIPLIGYDWGPRDKWIHITSESPDSAKELLGRSIYDDNQLMLMLRLMLMNATEIYAYIPDGKGTKAKKEVTMDLPAVAQTDLDKAVMAIVKGKLGVKEEQAGANLAYDSRSHKFIVTLAGPVSGVSGTGIIDTVEALVSGGYKVTADGTEVRDEQTVKSGPYMAALGAMAPEGEDVTISVVVSKDTDEQDYSIVVTYPKQAPSVSHGLTDITAKQTKITVDAKYTGSLGNKIQLVSVANPMGGYDVSVVLAGTEAELFEGVSDAADLSKSAYVVVKATEGLTAFASLTLEGGADGENQNASVSKFLDAAEKVKFNCMSFPTTDPSLITALISKIQYIRNAIGWKCHAVAVKTRANYEGIYNLTNAFAIEGKDLEIIEATAWLAGAVAGASYVTSLTYKVVDGATGVVGELSNEQSIEAIKAGETFFTVDENGNVILEYDVNSKVTFKAEDPVDINKGRPCRVYDTFANDLLLTFVPGKFNNNAEGWTVMEGLGRAMLQNYADDGAIQNVNLEADFVVDQGKSIGDSVYINVGIQSVDSAEKYYFTVVAR